MEARAVPSVEFNGKEHERASAVVLENVTVGCQPSRWRSFLPSFNIVCAGMRQVKLLYLY